MENKLHHSHDKLFRETWSNLNNAKSFLENYLPEHVIKLVRLDTLEICKDSFIEKDLQDFYSDMLYNVRIGDAPGYVYPNVAEVMWILASRHQAYCCSKLPQKLDNAEDEIHMASPKGKNFK